MPEFELANGNGNGHVVSDPLVTAPYTARRGMTDEELRFEIDGYVREMQSYRRMDPDEVFRSLSGITSRLTEIRLVAMRSTARRAAALKNEVDTLLEEAERQFRQHSRLHTTRAFDWDVSGRGQT